MSPFNFLTLDDVESSGKRVFLRVDINVPLDPSTHEILDDTRIRAVSSTLADLTDARVVLCSHQSRPGKDDFTSLEPHATLLSHYCSQEVKFVDDVLGSHARKEIGSVKPGEILVLDNLRFCAEENIDEKPEKLVKTLLVKRLAPLFDLYVNDAFATAHRSQPSITGLPEVLPSVAGRLMEKEMTAVTTLLLQPKRPCVYVLGGAKAQDKVPVIENILSKGKADKVMLGGIPAKLFLKARGRRLSPPDEKDLSSLGVFLDQAKALVGRYGERIEAPTDLAYEVGGKRTDRRVDGIATGGSGLDVGSETIDNYSKIVKGAATIVANGPLGVFERNGFDVGTKSILESMVESDGYTIIGGGHLVGLASILGIDEKFSHVSTAGGAMLSLLSGQTLPGVDALIRAAARTTGTKSV